MDTERLKTEVMSFLPQGVALVLGLEIHDPILASLAALTIFTEGANKLREMNKSWLEEYATNDDVIKELDYFIKTPEFIQFLREVLIKVSYETRYEKRKALLHAAWNYVLKKEKFTFDEKMMLLNLLDQISELELIYLIHIYSNKEINIELLPRINQLSIPNKLASLGLLDTDYSSIQLALEKINKDAIEIQKILVENMEEVKKKIIDQDTRWGISRNYNLPKNYNSFFDEIKLKYNQNELGRKFVELICLYDLKPL